MLKTLPGISQTSSLITEAVRTAPYASLSVVLYCWVVLQTALLCGVSDEYCSFSRYLYPKQPTERDLNLLDR